MTRLEIRLEDALMRLARQYAPQIVPAGWQAPGDYAAPLGTLAGALAGHNLLVMLGAPPAVDAETGVTRWVQSYVTLYDLLTRRLFPSFTQVKAFYADGEQPPIVVIQGAATPVFVVLASYVAPYLAARQDGSASDLELFGLMDLVLEALEANDLPRDEYRHLRDDAAAQLRRLVAAPVRQQALTPPHRRLVEAFALPPAVVFAPDAPSVTEPPAHLPETPANSSAPTFGDAIPIFYNRRARGKRPPPVPPLPKT